MNTSERTIVVIIVALGAAVVCGCGGGESASIALAPDMRALGASLPTYTSQNALDGQLWALIAGAGQNDPTKGTLIGRVGNRRDACLCGHAVFIPVSVVV